jgi:hypothetical protein
MSISTAVIFKNYNVYLELTRKSLNVLSCLVQDICIGNGLEQVAGEVSVHENICQKALF